MSLDRIKNKVITGATVLTFFIFSLFTVPVIQTHANQGIPIIEQTLVQDTAVNCSDSIDTRDSIQQELVNEVDRYISKHFPKSKLSPEAVVQHCIHHDFDIAFAMAQTEIESGYGVAGKAKRTNSPWNVGAWDGRSVQTMNKLGYGYSHPDQAIEPYILLIKTKYLGNKKSIHDLMRNYISLSGHRYAGDPLYEVTLKKTYQKICTKTTIKKLQEQLSELG